MTQRLKAELIGAKMAGSHHHLLIFIKVLISVAGSFIKGFGNSDFGSKNSLYFAFLFIFQSI